MDDLKSWLRERNSITIDITGSSSSRRFLRAVTFSMCLTREI
jgi:hypothetical protein